MQNTQNTQNNEKNVVRFENYSDPEVFIARHAKMLFVLAIVLVVVAAGSVAFFSIKNKIIQSGLSKVYEISYILGQDAKDANEDQLTAKKATALEALKPLCSKGGIVGVRANLLAAEICYIDKDFQNAILHYKEAANKKTKVYTSSLAFYNMATCLEELGQNKEALECYEKASKYKDFYLWTHAAFNVGRLNEVLGDYDKALLAYNNLFNDSPLDSYAVLAHDRVIYIETQGLVTKTVADLPQPPDTQKTQEQQEQKK